MVAVVAKDDVARTLTALHAAGETAITLGRITVAGAERVTTLGQLKL